MADARAVLWTAGLWLVASGCGGTGDGAARFELVEISVPQGVVPVEWEVNREIRFVFNAPVDFSTVQPNSVQIRQSESCAAGSNQLPPIPSAPAGGTFHLVEPSVVAWRPVCPTFDGEGGVIAGLAFPSVAYEIFVFGLTGHSGPEVAAGSAVHAADGRPLTLSQSRCFVTPDSNDPGALFLDEVPGPAAPALDAIGRHRTHLELGDPAAPERVYFVPENDQVTEAYATSTGAPGEVVLVTSAGGDGVLDGARELNLASDRDTRVAVLLELDQPVNPTPENLHPGRVRLEWRPADAAAPWRALSTRVELAANCGGDGASVRLTPRGVLPQRSLVRVVLTAEFEDLVGESGLVDLTEAFVFRTGEYDFGPEFSGPATRMADERFESFTVGGDAPSSLEDTDAVFAEQRAEWEGGRLRAAVGFEGEGGVDGEFDLYVGPNETLVLDTQIASVSGGPSALPPATTDSTNQTVVAGVLDVRNLFIAGPSEENPLLGTGTLAAVGSNPLVIRATGNVIIRGTIDVSGFNAKDVGSLNTGNQPEVGAPGVAGGGKGGDGSALPNTSTPTGQTGSGPFGLGNLGGRGGETGFGLGGVNGRRPGGGGGGAFGADDPNVDGSLPFGFEARPGVDGSLGASGALSKKKPPKGGAVGVRPFTDGIPGNDFYGLRRVVLENGHVELVTGELDAPRAGYGGGAGGDAVPATSFPHPAWDPTTDEKGGGGGGGAGQLRIQALGNIVIEGEGRILAAGGRGAIGENNNILGAPFPGPVGGGGGGGSGGHVLLASSETIDLSRSTLAPKIIVARGGRGGSGSLVSGQSAGGDGGPGIIQLHVREPETDLLLPPDASLSGLTDPPPLVCLPDFGGVSKARSRWIALGDASHDPVEPSVPEPVEFLFDGTLLAGPDAGRVLTTDGTVVELVEPALQGLPVLQDPFVGGPADLLLDASSLLGTADDLYLRNPALLTGFGLDLVSAGSTSRHDVVVARPGSEPARLELVLEPALAGPAGSGATASLVPRAFRVATGSQLDLLPDGTSVRIEFQAAGATLLGEPDEAEALGPWTADPGQLTPGGTGFPFADPPAYYRFRVEFDLAADGFPLVPNGPRPELRFLRTGILF